MFRVLLKTLQIFVLLPILGKYHYTFCMRLLNLFFVSLLCVAIPLQGIAGMLAAKNPCPAESAAITALNTGNDHGCCNDAATVVKIGKPCKADQSCQPATPGMINQTESRPMVSIGTKIPLISSGLALNFEASATWRPPNPV